MVFVDKEISYIQTNYEDIVQTIKKQMNRCFGSILNRPIDLICISFMHTSLYFGQPRFRISFFQKEEMWEKSECELEIPADWLFHEWRKDITTESQMLELRREIKTALIFASCVFKYALYRCDQFKNYKSLLRQDELCIMFGEYKDWQYPIYWEKNEIDIFNRFSSETMNTGNKDNNSLEFRCYQNKVYNEKEFCKFKMKQSRFLGCKFENCNLDDNDLCDVLYSDCQFKNCKFTNCLMYGIMFEHCRFENTTMEACQLKFHKEEGIHIPGIYQDSRFINCNMEDITFTETSIEEVQIS